MSHHALHGTFPEVIRAVLHDQPEHSDVIRIALQDPVGHETFAGFIRFDNSPDEVLRNIIIVGEQLLRILGQAVASVPEGGIVVVVANTRIEAHAFDNLPRVQPLRLRIGVQLVEERHPQRQISVSEQLDV